MTLSGSGLNTSSYSHLNHGPGVSNAHMNTGNLNNNNMSGGGDGIGNNNNNNPHANNPGNDFGRNTKSLSGIPGLSGFNLNMHLNSLNKNNNGNNNNNNNHGNHNTNINNAGGNQNMPNNSFVNNNNSDIMSSSLETPSSLNFSSGQNNNSNDNNKTLLKSYNSSSLQLHNPHAMQSHNSEGSLQHFNSGTLQHFGSNMSGLYSKMPLLSSFNIRKNDDYLMSPWSSLGSRGAPANQPQGGGPQHQQQQQQQQRRGFSGMDVDDGGNGQNNNFTFQHSGLSNPQMFRSTSDPKALINALHSGMSEMSESSVELLRNIIHNQDSTGIDRRGVHTPLTAALAARSLSGGLGSGFSSAMAVEHKKRRLECVSPIAERPPQRVQVQPSNFAEVLSKPVLETSMDEIVEAMSLINTGCFVPEDHKLKQLELVVKDRERRADRFHKKKTSADFFTKKIRSLKKKAYSTASSTASNLAGNQKTNSSGQGCTIVVFHRKCQKHSRSCNMDAQSHGPTDIVLSSEPVTRSSYGKWMNAYMKHEKIDG